MATVSISEIRDDLPAYLRRVQAGEAIIITDNNRPIAEIKPLMPSVNGQRPFGLCANEFQIQDVFDSPLPDDILRDFGSL